MPLKIPLQIIIGKNEMQTNSVNLRRFGSLESKVISLDEFYELIQKEVNVEV